MPASTKKSASTAPAADAAATTSSKVHTIQRATLSKPLAVRATSSTSSDKLGDLPAGTVVYILETPREFKEGGPLRAPVAVVDAASDLPKGWVTLNKDGDDFVVMADKDIVYVPKEPMEPSKLSKPQLATKSAAASKAGTARPKESARNTKESSRPKESARAPKKKDAHSPTHKKKKGKKSAGGAAADGALDLDDIDLDAELQSVSQSQAGPAELETPATLLARAEYFGVQATKTAVRIQTMTDLEVRLGQALQSLAEQPGHRMQDLFDLFDRNGDAKINKMEFRQRVRELGFAATKGEVSAVDAIFAKYDVDGSADIDMSELHAALAELRARAQAFREAETQAEEQKAAYEAMAAAATQAAALTDDWAARVAERDELKAEASIEARLGALLIKEQPKAVDVPALANAIKQLVPAAVVQCTPVPPGGAAAGAASSSDASGSWGVGVTVTAGLHVSRSGLEAHLMAMGLELTEEERPALAPLFFGASVASLPLEAVGLSFKALHERQGAAIRKGRSLGETIARLKEAAVKAQDEVERLVQVDAAKKAAQEEAARKEADAKLEEEAKAKAEADAAAAAKQAAAEEKKKEFEAKVDEKRAQKGSLHESRGEIEAKRTPRATPRATPDAPAEEPPAEWGAIIDA